MNFREAAASDAKDIAAIYNHFILNTAITFEEEEVGDTEMARRVFDVQSAGLPWLVAEDGSRVVGYAYATKWRVRHAYRFSVESTVYVAPEFAGRGIGNTLYSALIERLHSQGYHLVIGGIALPNERSIALHEKLGFRKVAQFNEVGFKFGRWLDVGYWQLTLAAS